MHEWATIIIITIATLHIVLWRSLHVYTGLYICTHNYEFNNVCIIYACKFVCLFKNMHTVWCEIDCFTFRGPCILGVLR